MANDKDINIGIKVSTDASGAKEAQQAIEGVGDGGAAAMAKAEGAGDELEKALEDLKARTDELAGSLSEASEESGQLDENVDRIARVQKAQAVAELAQGVGRIADKFREAADEVEEFDHKSAVSLRETAERVDMVSNSVATLAMGFAVGGPLGAAVAGLALSIGAVVEAFKDSEVAALRAAASEKKAMREVEDSIRKTAAAAEEREAAFSNGEILGSLANELEATRSITEELREQLEIAREKRRIESEVLGANDQADLAEIDKQVATGEITEVEAAEKRAEIEAAARKRGREEKKRSAIEDAILAAKDAEAKIRNQEEAQKAFEKLETMRKDAEEKATGLADYAETEIGKMVPDKKTGQLSESDSKFAADIGKEVEAARNVLTITEAAAAEAGVELQQARNEASKAMRDVDRTTGRAGDVVSGQNRIGEADARTVATRGETRSVEARKREEEAERKAKIRQLRGERETVEEDLDLTASANESKIKNSPIGRDNKALQKLADDIGNANTAAEINAVKDAVKAKSGELSEAIVSALEAMISKQEAMLRTIGHLKDRIKRLEDR